MGRSISRPVTRAKRKTVIPVELGRKGYEVFTATPVRRFSVRDHEVAIASLGLLYKFSGAAALVGNDIYEEKPDKLKLYTSFKALGVIGEFNAMRLADIAGKTANILCRLLHLGSGAQIDRR